jgi:hypothetical protein
MAAPLNTFGAHRKTIYLKVFVIHMYKTTLVLGLDQTAPQLYYDWTIQHHTYIRFGLHKTVPVLSMEYTPRYFMWAVQHRENKLITEVKVAVV